MRTDSSRNRPLFDEAHTYREMFEQLNNTYMSVMDELTASVYPKGIIKLKMTLSHDVELDEIIVGWECSGDVPKKKTVMKGYVNPDAPVQISMDDKEEEAPHDD